MQNKHFIEELQKRMSDGYKIIDFINHSQVLIISIEDSKACIEFEKIRKTIVDQLSNINFTLRCDFTGKKEEYQLGNIVKATLGDKNTLNLSYNLKRTNR